MNSSDLIFAFFSEFVRLPLPSSWNGTPEKLQCDFKGIDWVWLTEQCLTSAWLNCIVQNRVWLRLFWKLSRKLAGGICTELWSAVWKGVLWYLQVMVAKDVNIVVLCIFRSYYILQATVVFLCIEQKTWQKRALIVLSLLKDPDLYYQWISWQYSDSLLTEHMTEIQGAEELPSNDWKYSRD